MNDNAKDKNRNLIPRPGLEKDGFTCGRHPVHGLFFDPRKHQLDGRSRIARIIKDVVHHLLLPFPEPRPVGAILIARQAAYKALRLRSFEHWVLTGQKLPAKTTDDAYLLMSNSLTKDIELLHRMAKDGSPAEKAPTLAEYLAALQSGKIVPVEAAQEEG